MAYTALVAIGYLHDVATAVYYESILSKSRTRMIRKMQSLTPKSLPGFYLARIKLVVSLGSLIELMN